MLSIISLLLGLISLVIMVVIALRQGLVLKQQGVVLKQSHQINDKTLGIAEETKNIGVETKSITEKLATDYFIQEKSSRLFLTRKKSSELSQRYKIVYPVKYTDRPLPLINQGDFYAIHILSVALGLERIDLKEIESEQISFDNNLTKGNVIFICSPQANPALNSVFPYATICNQSEKDMNITRQHPCCSNEEVIAWFRDKVKLPCWFVDECKVQYDSTGKKELALIKKIKIYDNNDDSTDISSQALESQAEECYNAARIRHKKIECSNVVDYGIFARITKDENQYMIISGIHQYGTWIVSDYINNILRNRKVSKAHLDIYERENDFIGIIIGEYNSKKMSVEFSSVYGNKLWMRTNEDQWIISNKLQEM